MAGYHWLTFPSALRACPNGRRVGPTDSLGIRCQRSRQPCRRGGVASPFRKARRRREATSEPVVCSVWFEGVWWVGRNLQVSNPRARPPFSRVERKEVRKDFRAAPPPVVGLDAGVLRL